MIARDYGFGDVVRVRAAQCDRASGLFRVVGHTGDGMDLYLSSDLRDPRDFDWIMHPQRVEIVQRAEPELVLVDIAQALACVASDLRGEVRGALASEPSIGALARQHAKTSARLHAALDRIGAAADVLPSDVLVRASRLAEALAVVAMGRTQEAA